MKRIIFFLMLVPSAALGQLKFTYSPTSVKGWGNMPSAMLFRLSYRFNLTNEIGGEAGFIHLYHRKVGVVPANFVKGTPIIKSTTGIYFSPLAYEWEVGYFYMSFMSGFVIFNKKTPTAKGTHLNIMFELAFSIPVNNKIKGSLSYIHISNAFTGQFNPGYDFPSISVSYNL